MQFKRAVKAESFLRMALAGPSGSGKTYTALAIAEALAAGKRVAVLDTERGSASKYSDLFPFDVIELDTFHPDRYVEVIHAAEEGGYGVLVIDSLSHAWNGTGGLLELVEAIAKRKGGNTYAAWAEATPIQNRLIDAITRARLHVIVTMRSKQDYILEKDERTGKTSPRKVGMAPIQRDGMEYEMDVAGDLDHDNTLIIQKSRCPALSGRNFTKAGADVANILTEWLRGEPVTDTTAQEQPRVLVPQVKPTAVGATPASDASPRPAAKPAPKAAPVADAAPLPTWNGIRLAALEAGYKTMDTYQAMLRDVTGKSDKSDKSQYTDADKQRVLDFLDGKPTADEAPAVAYPGAVVVDPDVMEATA